MMLHDNTLSLAGYAESDVEQGPRTRLAANVEDIVGVGEAVEARGRALGVGCRLC
jgi:hypothetical protein